jgi:hypothetical protein
MTISPKAVVLLAGVLAAAACDLAACDKSPGRANAGSETHGTAATTTDQISVEKFKAPPLPDPSRTDPEAVAMRQRYVDWHVAQVKAANATTQKQLEQFYGPAPKGNYGRMADGLPQPADHK